MRGCLFSVTFSVCTNGRFCSHCFKTDDVRESDKGIEGTGLKALGDASACACLSSPNCGLCCLVNGEHLPHLCCPKFAFFSWANSPHSLVFSPSSCVLFCTLEDPGCQNNTRLANPFSPGYQVDADDSSYVTLLILCFGKP